MAYIERNPVRAGLTETAEDYPWSSAAAHVSNRDNHALIDLSPWRDCYTSERWRDGLQFGIEEEGLSERLRVATATGRPFGSADFVDTLESTANRTLRPGRPGRPRRPTRKEPGQLSLEIGV